MVYKFSTTRGKMSGLSPQVAGEELERIREVSGGELRPIDVVESARNEDSPLHQVFEWDDSEAAQQYRLHQARSFIQTLVVVYENEGVSDEPSRAFYNVTVQVKDEEGVEKQKRFYQSASVLVTKPDQFASARNTLVGELANAQTSLERLLKLAPDRHAKKVDRAVRHVGEAHKNLMSIEA